MTSGGPDHSHASPPSSRAGDFRGRLWVAFGITAGIVMAQAVGSAVTGSLALLTDTAHAITDASGLLIALIAGTLVLRPSSARRTWGFRRLEVIAALGQAVMLLAVGLYTAIEGVRRLFAPSEIAAAELLFFGVVGLAANVAAIVVLSGTRGANFNMRAAFLEVLNDALGSLGVIAAAIVVATTGFMQADAIAGLLIAALIMPRAFRLLHQTGSVLMEFTPAGLDLEEVRSHLLGLDHVRNVHDLHASTVATGLPILSGHIVVEDECFTDGHAARLLREAKACVAAHFEVPVQHSTFQVEPEDLQEQEPAVVDHA